MDIGSGAGFPAIVCAICTQNNFHLIEANKKKCLFLNKVKKIINIKNISIKNSRIENFEINRNYDYIVARAVSSLDKLIKYTHKFYKKNMSCIFMKGKTAENEVKIAKKKFIFDVKYVNSITESESKN